MNNNNKFVIIECNLNGIAAQLFTLKYFTGVKNRQVSYFKFLFKSFIWSELLFLLKTFQPRSGKL